MLVREFHTARAVLSRTPLHPCCDDSAHLAGLHLVTVQFIVDTTGRVELESVKGVHVGDSVLFRATIKGLSTWRYRPAVWNQCWYARQFVRTDVVRPAR